MSFKCGIVGLPNVGKSTLFNAISNNDIAETGNYPFCTIEPNKSTVMVTDRRLNEISKISQSQNIIPTTIEFVDIAGLVKNASKGEGLGNGFLSTIREVDAIIHLVRCFDSEDIIHTSGKIDPIDDIDIIHTELLLKDMEVLQNALEKIQKKKKKEDEEYIECLQMLLKTAENGNMLRTLDMSKDFQKPLQNLGLLTLKPMIYVLNVDEVTLEKRENHLTKKVEGFLKEKCILVSSKFELDLSKLEDEAEKQDMMSIFGIDEPILNTIIRTAYSTLNLISFFTSGVQETRAWTVRKNATAPQAAGEIHTVFEKGFIKAEVMSCDDFIKFNGEQGCKENGKLRLEGKEYIVQDGDIMHFKFNV